MAEDFTLSLRVIPDGQNATKGEAAPRSGTKEHAIGAGIDQERVFVLGWVRQPAQRGEKVIAAGTSFELGPWLQLQKEGVEFRWDSPPWSLLAAKLPLKTPPIFSEGEMGMVQATRAQNFCSTVNGFVESPSDLNQVSHRISFKVVGDIGQNPDFVNDLTACTIALGEVFNVSVEKSVALLLEIFDISLKPRKW